MVKDMTNASKGVAIAASLLVIEGLEVFGIHDFTEAQSDWITRAVAMGGLLWIAATRNWSKHRNPGG